VNRVELALVVGLLQRPLSDIGGVLHHLHQAPFGVQNRVVAGFDPDVFARLGPTPEQSCSKLAGTQRRPEIAISHGAHLFRRHQLRVVLTNDLGCAVAQHHEEVVIGFQHLALDIKRNDPHHASDRQHLATHVGGLQLVGADVGGDLHYLDDFAGTIQYRVVAGLQPHFAPALGESFETSLLCFAARQFAPELGVGLAARIGFGHEQPMVLTANFLQAVSHRLQEVGIGIQDFPLRIEFDNRLGLGQCMQGGLPIAGGSHSQTIQQGNDVRHTGDSGGW